jgi:hypothetical protein
VNMFPFFFVSSEHTRCSDNIHGTVKYHWRCLKGCFDLFLSKRVFGVKGTELSLEKVFSLIQ